MTDETESKIHDSNLSTAELISYFREKCKICGHHRIMHDELGACEGVMNKPDEITDEQFDQRMTEIGEMFNSMKNIIESQS